MVILNVPGACSVRKRASTLVCAALRVTFSPACRCSSMASSNLRSRARQPHGRAIGAISIAILA